jgi:two-component system nitrogen regulation response regulator GlnG
MPTLLVIDDEQAIRHAFQRAFRADELTVQTATTAAEAVAVLDTARPDVIILDVHLPDGTGLDTFRRLRAIDARVPVIIVTGHGTTDLAIEAMKEGAYEYLLKPLELADLRRLVERAVRSSRLMHTPAAMPEVEPTPAGGDVLLGRCPAMQEVYKAVGRVTESNVTVLILGESGTGKELVARAIYQHSKRAPQPFLAINCAAIPEALLESELFGHEKGAFTGADRKRIGKFEQCHGGTIFLDEIGEMTPRTQAKILRLVQEQRFERLGGTETVQTDVRLIAATNANLERMTEDGRFRRDLYFRLNVFTIQLPPLRDRGDDVGLLIEHYARIYGRELNKPVVEIGPQALAALKAYSWPGNVRELQSAIKQSVLRMSGSALLVEFLPAAIRNPVGSVGATEESGDASGGFDWDHFVAGRITAQSENLYAEALERMEREILVRVLKHTEGNQLQAARILGITRGSLRNKIRSLGISIARSIWSDDDQSEG